MCVDYLLVVRGVADWYSRVSFPCPEYFFTLTNKNTNAFVSELAATTVTVVSYIRSSEYESRNDKARKIMLAGNQDNKFEMVRMNSCITLLMCFV